MRPRRLLPTAAVAATVVLAFPVAAHASAWPAKPSGVRLASVSASSFTVTMSRGSNVRDYVVWASTTRSDLYYATLTAHKRPSTLHYGISTSPTVTVKGLAYTTNAYYCRIETRNGGNRVFGSSFYSLGLEPATPTGLQLTTGTSGTYLTWSSGAVTGFDVQVAANAAMTTAAHTYSIRGNNHQYTPYGLTAGQPYWFRIRAVNHNSTSSFTATVTGSTQTREQGVRVMTYNLLGLGQDGTKEKGGTVAPWSQRRIAMAALIKSVQPEVIGVQEASDWVGSTPGVRQADSLASALQAIGAPFVVARTETPYPERGWERWGDYILYDSSRYQEVSAGHWRIGTAQAAVYAELRSRASGATFLFVTTHLLQAGGRSNDLAREDETKQILQLAGALAAQDHLPVVYGGDFNSNPEQTTIDGPGVAMQSARIADARLIAQYRVNETYDSMNNYSRTPYPYSFFLDYVWASPGVSASSWGEAMNLSHGQLVGTIPSDHNPVYAYLRFPY